MKRVHRRGFLGRTAGLAGGVAALAASTYARAGRAPNERVQLAVIGLGPTGSARAAAFAKIDGFGIAALCDVNKTRLDVAKKYAPEAKQFEDARKLFDDGNALKALDAVVIATPTHWHALPAVLAMRAGKHVYLELPATHNVAETELLAREAKKNRSVVHCGSPARSDPELKKILEGGTTRVGNLRAVRVSVTHRRLASKPAQEEEPVPAALNFLLWLGPAAVDRAYNKFLYNGGWRRYQAFGTGNMTDSTAQLFDVAWMGLPDRKFDLSQVTCGGGDLHEVAGDYPDTQTVTYTFPDLVWVFEYRAWDEKQPRSAFRLDFIGDSGTFTLTDRAWTFAPHREKGEPGGGNWAGLGARVETHMKQFLTAIKEQKSAAGIDVVKPSIETCHLGNVAWQLLGKNPEKPALKYDAERHRFTDPEANKFLTREYRKGFEPLGL
jgi:predicted dehydrogenase